LFFDGHGVCSHLVGKFLLLIYEHFYISATRRHILHLSSEFDRPFIWQTLASL
jgi:hypothetical protein